MSRGNTKGIKYDIPATAIFIKQVFLYEVTCKSGREYRAEYYLTEHPYYLIYDGNLRIPDSHPEYNDIIQAVEKRFKGENIA